MTNIDYGSQLKNVAPSPSVIPSEAEGSRRGASNGGVVIPSEAEGSRRGVVHEIPRQARDDGRAWDGGGGR